MEPLLQSIYTLAPSKKENLKVTALLKMVLPSRLLAQISATIISLWQLQLTHWLNEEPRARRALVQWSSNFWHLWSHLRSWLTFLISKTVTLKITMCVKFVNTEATLLKFKKNMTTEWESIVLKKTSPASSSMLSSKQSPITEQPLLSQVSNLSFLLRRLSHWLAKTRNYTLENTNFLGEDP